MDPTMDLAYLLAASATSADVTAAPTGSLSEIAPILSAIGGIVVAIVGGIKAYLAYRAKKKAGNRKDKSATEAFRSGEDFVASIEKVMNSRFFGAISNLQNDITRKSVVFCDGRTVMYRDMAGALLSVWQDGTVQFLNSLKKMAVAGELTPGVVSNMASNHLRLLLGQDLQEAWKELGIPASIQSKFYVWSDSRFTILTWMAGRVTLEDETMSLLYDRLNAWYATQATIASLLIFDLHEFMHNMNGRLDGLEYTHRNADGSKEVYKLRGVMAMTVEAYRQHMNKSASDALAGYRSTQSTTKLSPASIDDGDDMARAKAAEEAAVNKAVERALNSPSSSAVRPPVVGAPKDDSGAHHAITTHTP